MCSRGRIPNYSDGRKMCYWIKNELFFCFFRKFVYFCIDSKKKINEKHSSLRMEVLCRWLQKYDMGAYPVDIDILESHRSFFRVAPFLFRTDIGRKDGRAEDRACGKGVDEVMIEMKN